MQFSLKSQQNSVPDHICHPVVQEKNNTDLRATHELDDPAASDTLAGLGQPPLTPDRPGRGGRAVHEVGREGLGAVHGIAGRGRDRDRRARGNPLSPRCRLKVNRIESNIFRISL